MTSVDSEAASAILRATHIFLIRIESARPSPWVETDNGPKRTVDLQLRLDEVLKGKVAEPVGSVIPIKAEQTGRPGGRIFAVPGVWSDHELEQGHRFVAFSNGEGDRAAALLEEPALDSVLAAAESLDDVRLAMQAERAGLDLGAIVELARLSAAKLHYPFAEYLAAKAQKVLLVNRTYFTRLAGLLEDPALSPLVRSTLVEDINSGLLASDPAPGPFLTIWVATLFRVAGMAEAEGLRDNILRVFLPNLLGLTSGAVKKKASELFKDQPQVIAQANRLLAAHPAGTDALRKWLHE